MPRQLVYSNEEILAKDINNIINSLETTLFNSFIGNAIPELPAFVGSSLLCQINGSDITVSRGIGFQTKSPAPTDGSTPVALIKLDDTMTLTPNLPSGNVTKTDLIEVKWQLDNEPTESRTYTTGTGTVDRPTVTMNRWSANIRIKENVTQDANGDYNPSIGYARLALITSTSTGIQSLVDVRRYFNMFDPDLFTLFGRKNISLSRNYDGVNLIEVPFEFSPQVPKIDQISARVVKKEKYIIGTISSTHRSSNFTLVPPVTRSVNTGVLFGTKPSILIRSLNHTSTAHYWFRNRASFFYDTSLIYSVYFLIRLQGSLGSYYVEDFKFSTGVPGQYVNDASSLPSSSIQADFESKLKSVLGFSSPSTFSNGIYAILVNLTGISSNPTSKSNITDTNSDIFYLRPNRIVYQDRSNIFYAYSSLDTIRRGSTFVAPDASQSGSKLGLLVSTQNPVQSGTTTTYDYNGNAINISTWAGISFLDFTFDTATRLLTIKLQSSQSTFPSNNFVTARIKKGSSIRLTKQYNEFTTDISGNTLTLTYTLSSSENIIRSSDSTFTDFNLEFDTGDRRNEDVYRANQLLKTRHFEVVEEDVRTYIRIKPGSTVISGDEIILSHIIPPALLDAQEGSPAQSDTDRDISTLKTQVQELITQQTTNTTKITALEAQRGLDTSSNILWGYGAVQAIASDSANAANREANTAFAVAGNRNSQSSSNIAQGALVRYAAPAATGYYHPFMALEISKIDTIRFENDVSDETDLWSIATPSTTIAGTDYVLYARSVPLEQSETLTILVKSFD